MAENLRLYQLMAGTEGIILEQCMVEAENIDAARSMAHKIGLLHPAKGYDTLQVKYFGRIKHRDGNSGITPEPGELFYHVIYVDSKGEKHHDVFYIYRPGCNMRENPYAQFARWFLPKNQAGERVVLYDLYMEDHQGKRVDW